MGTWASYHLNLAMIPSKVVSDHLTSVYLFVRLLLLELLGTYAYTGILGGKFFLFCLNPQFQATLGH